MNFQMGDYVAFTRSDASIMRGRVIAINHGMVDYFVKTDEGFTYAVKVHELKRIPRYEELETLLAVATLSHRVAEQALEILRNSIAEPSYLGYAVLREAVDAALEQAEKEINTEAEEGVGDDTP